MRQIFIILFMLCFTLKYFTQNNTKVIYEKSILSINKNVVFDSARANYTMSIFEYVFNEKPKRYKNKYTNLYDFVFCNTGSSVSQSSKDKIKKSYPFQLTFDYQYNSYLDYIPWEKRKLFTGEIYINGIKIDSTTTYKNIRLLNKDDVNDGSKFYSPNFHYKRFYFEFEDKIQNPKIMRVTFTIR